jgi:hypothetical protein
MSEVEVEVAGAITRALMMEGRQIPAAFIRLAAGIESLTSVMGELETRLVPVLLVKDEEEEQGGGGVVDFDDHTPMTKLILAMSAKTRECSDVAERLLERLEV